MLVTRIAHALIIAVIAAAAAAVAMIVRPDTATHPPAIEFQRVVDYSRYGVIDTISGKGQVVTVHFRPGFDTKGQLGADTHTFEASLPPGTDLASALAAAGVPSAQHGGPKVTVAGP